MKMDKFTKIMLTFIAAGVIGINFHFYKINLVKEVNASDKLIDLMSMQDKIIERIAFAEVTINRGINNLKKEQRIQYYLTIGTARELGVQEERLMEVIRNSVVVADL